MSGWAEPGGEVCGGSHSDSDSDSSKADRTTHRKIHMLS